MPFETLGQSFSDEIQRTTFKSRQKRAEDQLNQTIHIRDMVVFSTDQNNCGEAGEYKSAYAEQIPSYDRLKAHIAFLFDTVTLDHRRNYCREIEHEVYQIKPSKENHVTRLSTAEFFFIRKIHSH